MPVTAVVKRTSPTMANVKRVDSFMAWPRRDRTPGEPAAGKMLPRSPTAGPAGGAGTHIGSGRVAILAHGLSRGAHAPPRPIRRAAARCHGFSPGEQGMRP